MSSQTYDNYHRAYYLKNRKKILARTKEYRRKYAKDYYYRKKAEKIGAERALKLATVGVTQEGPQVATLPAKPSVELVKPATDKSQPFFDDALPSPEVYNSVDYLRSG